MIPLLFALVVVLAFVIWNLVRVCRLHHDVLRNLAHRVRALEEDHRDL